MINNNKLAKEHTQKKTYREKNELRSVRKKCQIIVRFSVRFLFEVCFVVYCNVNVLISQHSHQNSFILNNDVIIIIIIIINIYSSKMSVITCGDAILSLLVEHGGLEQMKRKEGWKLLQSISCCNRYLYDYIKQRMTHLRLAIMGTFVVRYHKDLTVLHSFYEKNGKREGTERRYVNSHIFPDELNYENDELHGQTRIYHTGVPHIERTVTYENGVKKGLCVYYHENGQLEKIYYHDNQNQNIQWKHYLKYDNVGQEVLNNWDVVEARHKAKKQKNELKTNIRFDIFS